ncbi:MAG: hypothetical protein E5299_00800 [Burkholderia gladioli]|nr:MAG: hypothetical protein E5299_00800 [Burkholderia gladioli]
MQQCFRTYGSVEEVLADWHLTGISTPTIMITIGTLETGKRRQYARWLSETEEHPASLRMTLIRVLY